MRHHIFPLTPKASAHRRGTSRGARAAQMRGLMETEGKLLDQMRQVLRLKHMSIRTEKAMSTG
jgi:hypothetical protein